ncbi:hypothetical protein Aph01nite_52390 [Acrocarpospora phusangensis]|uniref:Cell envelope-related transcriptional attenuator domain-containing protein n=1 Tax=Acrocarpospora phusangensis TaxID=1070424 RepID=A0A919UMG0_9ACTN|nr:LCP family protein [Acrocarpospora phusangensis]GIH26929.1 hypothetical protein Aph01nite_52390 [Acrocarpospora phusangensis]
MRENRSLGRALGLTLSSALLWGIAHLWAGRTKTGLILAGVYTLLLATGIAIVTSFRTAAFALLVRPGWLTATVVLTVGIAVAWALVIMWSYRLVRPPRLGGRRRVFAGTLVGAMCLVVAAPLAYAGRVAYVSNDLVTTVFSAAEKSGFPPGDERGHVSYLSTKPRVNILLIGADAAKNRPGARTDSMTVASVDTRTGQTYLFSLPRNLQNVPLPEGPARTAFPDGFTGGGDSPGLLNEVYQWGEDHPSIVPGVPDGKRGSTLLKATVGGILGLDIDYYAMVDMKGFAQLIDAIGGITVTVKEDIVYGTYREGLVRAGTRRLTGEEALWFGRSRTDSDDYVRMGRQKCLLNAVAKQANPLVVLRGFDQLATVAKRYISTDIPQTLLPPLMTLAAKVKLAQIRSLQFVPPLINTATPDWPFIQSKVKEALTAPLHRELPTKRDLGLTPPADTVSLDTTCG